MQAWPDVSDCPRLTVLKLCNMPPVVCTMNFETLPSLKELQITFAYIANVANFGRMALQHVSALLNADCSLRCSRGSLNLLACLAASAGNDTTSELLTKQIIL